MGKFVWIGGTGVGGNKCPGGLRDGRRDAEKSYARGGQGGGRLEVFMNKAGIRGSKREGRVNSFPCSSIWCVGGSWVWDESPLILNIIKVIVTWTVIKGTDVPSTISGHAAARGGAWTQYFSKKRS